MQHSIQNMCAKAAYTCIQLYIIQTSPRKSRTATPCIDTENIITLVPIKQAGIRSIQCPKFGHSYLHVHSAFCSKL